MEHSVSCRRETIVFWDFDPVGAGVAGENGGDPMCVHEPYITYVDRLRLAELIGREPERHPPVEELARALLRVAPFDPREIPADVVTMNSVVRVRDLRAGHVETRVLVYPGGGAPTPRVAGAEPVSVLSGMGTALLGRREGELVWWAEGGEGRVARVEGVLYQPEASGEMG